MGDDATHLLHRLLGTRRGRTTAFSVLGVLLLAAVVAIVWGARGGSPRQGEAVAAAETSRAATSSATTSSAAAPTTTAAPSPTAVATAAPTTTAAPAAVAVPTGTSTAAAARPAGPWCTSDCTATTPLRAMQLAVMALQAGDTDAYQQVTIDLDPSVIRAAMAQGTATFTPCTPDDGDAVCTVTFGSTAYDYSAQQLPYDPSEGPRDTPWAVTDLQPH